MIRNSALMSIAFVLLVTLADANPLLALEEATDAVAAAADTSVAAETVNSRGRFRGESGRSVGRFGSDSGLLYAGRFCLGGNRIHTGQKRLQHHDEKPDGLLHRFADILADRFRVNVRGHFRWMDRPR